MSVNGITTSGQVPITYTKRNVTGQKSKNDNPRTDTLTLTQEAQQFEVSSVYIASLRPAWAT